jgi:polyhydroxyalkanoate synthesis regulator phasin
MLNQVKEVPNSVGQGVGVVAGTTHKVMQASLGAAVMVQEGVATRMSNDIEIEEVVEDVKADTISFTDKLVERGDEAQKEMMETLHGWVDPQRERVEKNIHALTEKAETLLQKGIEGFMVRANIPTATDIQDLNKKIGALGRKVDRLRRAQEEALKKEA